MGFRQALVLVLLAACHHYRVISFDVTPHTACVGESVHVRWDVSGRARLAIIKGTKSPTTEQIQAAEKPVKSTDDQTFPVDETTTFVIYAVDANQAKDPWLGTKWVDVPVADETKGVTTTCTGSTCAGTFTIQAANSAAQVTRVSAPMMKQNGTSSPATIRVTHGAFAGVTLDSTHDITTPVAAAGEWTLETTLPEGGSSDPPPGLSVAVHISCP